LLNVSEGFVYDCLRWKVAQLDLAAHRQMVLAKSSGTLCVAELHPGRFTLLLATDPLADLPVAFALVGRNDQGHVRRFLKDLKNGGLTPRLVVSDGSSLDPAVLAELWPDARHPLCVFHVLKDVNDLIVAGVRRLAGALARRGNAGRQRARGRPRKEPQAAHAAAGPTLKEKAAFLRKHRFLIVQATSGLDKQQWADLVQMFGCLPELRTLWQFASAVRDLFEKEARVQTLWKRRATLLRREEYQQVPERVKALALLEAGSFRKRVACTTEAVTTGGSPVASSVTTGGSPVG
jgi:hypothetical protein